MWRYLRTRAVDVAHVVSGMMRGSARFLSLRPSLCRCEPKFVDHFCYINNPGVDKHPVVCIADECAVARTPAAERYEFQYVDYRCPYLLAARMCRHRRKGFAAFGVSDVGGTFCRLFCIPDARADVRPLEERAFPIVEETLHPFCCAGSFSCSVPSRVGYYGFFLETYESHEYSREDGGDFLSVDCIRCFSPF